MSSFLGNAINERLREGDMENNLHKELEDIVFSAAGGISDMAMDEIRAILDAVINSLPDTLDGETEYLSGYDDAICEIKQLLESAKEGKE